MQDFEFQRPQRLADAVQALKRNADAKLLAGGQSLLPVMKLGLAAPPALVSIAALPELRGIRRDGKDLFLGAATTHAEAAESPEVARAVPALAELAAHIGDAQVRGRGTIGGSLAHADPAADWPAAVLALGATIHTDRRTIAADAFFTGLFATALAPDEIVVAVRFPVPEKAAWQKFAHPASRFALVGVFVARTASGPRVAVTGAGTKVFRAAALEAALAKDFSPRALDGLALPADGLTSDAAASAEYRAHLAVVLARRAVEAAR
jgi:carbon-monoxide dehydrogenase medium subunit